MKKLPVVIMVLFSLSVAAEEKTDVGVDTDKFRLFNKCQPVTYSLALQDDDLGLSEEAIRTMIESRLRAARIYSDTEWNGSSIRVTINVNKNAFSTTIMFNKLFQDTVFSEDIGSAITWMEGGIGLSGGRADFVMNSVSQKMDGFINEYMRVNGSACGVG